MSEITCPSGLKGTIRKMKVQEARSFTTQRKQKGDPMGRLLSACWEETDTSDTSDNKGDGPHDTRVYGGAAEASDDLQSRIEQLGSAGFHHLFLL